MYLHMAFGCSFRVDSGACLLVVYAHLPLLFVYCAARDIVHADC